MTTAHHDVMPAPGLWSSFRPRHTVRAVLPHLMRTLREFARHAALGATPTVGMVRMITLLAGLAAFAISIAPPISWFLVAQSALRADIEGRARIFASHADVAELVDAHGSGPCRGNPVEVRVLSSACVTFNPPPHARLARSDAVRGRARALA